MELTMSLLDYIEDLCDTNSMRKSHTAEWITGYRRALYDFRTELETLFDLDKAVVDLPKHSKESLDELFVVRKNENIFVKESTR